jgi:3-phenylpropionate/trans-cinnamate dioxygenase ferredoxin reductase component
MSRTIVVIGGGHAAGRAVRVLRNDGFDGRIVLVGDETELPYERPPLSKQFLAGARQLEQFLVNPAAFYDEARIERMAGNPATAIDPQARRVTLADGTALPFDQLLLATGARARALPGVAFDRQKVFGLRNHGDALALRPLLQPGRHVVLVGGGFIGLEVAATARMAGCEVTVLEAAPALLGRVLGAELGALIEEMFRQKGVAIRKATAPARIDANGARVRIALSDGVVIEADLLIVGIGAVPNTELAQAAGLPCEDGVLVDTSGRTAAETIFAAGDVTRHPNSFYRRGIRLETWDNAEKQAAAAARAMLGKPTAHDEVPWMWTDLFERNIQIIGLPLPCEQRITRGTFGAGPFVSLGMADGRIVQAVMVDAGRERRPLARLITDRIEVAPAALADAARPLRSLA